MKQLTLGLFLFAAILSSCTKDKVAVKPVPVVKPVGSKSYIRLTINDKLLEARDTIVTYSEADSKGDFRPFLMMFTTSDNPTYKNTFDKNFSVNTFTGDMFYNGDLKLAFGSTRYASADKNIVDVYETLNQSPSAFFVQNLKTLDKYPINRGSKIMVEESNDDFTRGTMLLLLADGSSELTAKGEFKIYKRK